MKRIFTMYLVAAIITVLICRQMLLGSTESIVPINVPELCALETAGYVCDIKLCSSQHKLQCFIETAGYMCPQEGQVELCSSQHESDIDQRWLRYQQAMKRLRDEK